MTELLRLLHTPLGRPGSGRVRYGAAMGLHRAGRLLEAQLEVYREAAAHDGRDPAPILAERGLPPVPPAPQGPDAARAALGEAAADYLRGLRHPGAAEVRAGLAASAGQGVPGPGRPHPVAARWLAPALAAVGPAHAALAGAIAAAAPHLRWAGYDAYPRDEIGAAFAAGHAYAPLLPEEGVDFALGLFLIAPGILYRDHAHAAPELYAPLTGPHLWRFGPGRPLVAKPAHRPVWNPPFRPHLIRTGPAPFLAFYVWTRDVEAPAHVLPAADWAALEAGGP